MVEKRAMPLGASKDGNNRSNEKQSIQFCISDNNSNPRLQSRKENRTETVVLNHLSEETRARVHEILAPFYRVRNGRVDEAEICRHHISLATDLRPFRPQSYRAGHRAKQLKRDLSEL